MGSTKRKMRKASLAAFCVVALAAVCNANVSIQNTRGIPFESSRYTGCIYTTRRNAGDSGHCRRRYVVDLYVSDIALILMSSIQSIQASHVYTRHPDGPPTNAVGRTITAFQQLPFVCVSAQYTRPGTDSECHANIGQATKPLLAPQFRHGLLRQ